MRAICVSTMVLLCAHAFAVTTEDWIARFRFHPPEHGEDAPPVGVHETLPTFTLRVKAGGSLLARVSLPFAPHVLLSSERVAVEFPDGHRVGPQVRVLTTHGGPGPFVRRAMLTFPIPELEQDTEFACKVVRGEVAMAEMPALSLEPEEGKVVVRVGERRYAVSAAAEAADSGTWTLEQVETGPYFQWARLLLPDSRFPRIVEVQADATGAVRAAVHYQNLSDAYGYAPPFGLSIEITGDSRYDVQTDLAANGHLPEWMLEEFGLAVGEGSPFGATSLIPTPAGVKFTRMMVTGEEKLPHQLAAWRGVSQVIGRIWQDSAAIAVEEQLPLYPEAVSLPSVDPWPPLHGLNALHEHAMAESGMEGPDAGNVGNMPRSGVYGMNRLNHCPAMFQAGLGGGASTEAALAWCSNFHDLSIWWDASDAEGFGGTRYNNMAAMDKSFAQDPAFMWRSNSDISFCTKGYDSFLYAYELTGDPRYANALHWQTEYAMREIHADTGEARNIGDVRDFVRLYEMTGRRVYLEHGLRLFRELRTKLSTRDLFSQSGAPLEENLPFIDTDDFGYHHAFPKPYIMGYALAGLPALAKYFPEEPKLRDVIRAVADFIAATVDPVGGWRYPDPNSSTVLIGQGMEHAAQLCRAAEYLEGRGEAIDNLLDAVEMVLQGRVNGFIRKGGYLTGLAGWESSSGALKEGQTVQDLYKLPGERDKRRDYTQGSVGIGESNSVDGTVYFPEVLAYYLKHRPAERLYNMTPELRQVLERVPPEPRLKAEPEIISAGDARPQPMAPVKDYGMADKLPSFAAHRIEQMRWPMAWRNEQKRKPFEAWRKDAREKLLECLGPPPPRMSFEPELVATEDRGAYEARKLMLNLSSFYRVSAYLLVPKAPGPRPAVLALHDHGAHFSIGKEKVVRPFGVSAEVAADAQDWVTQYYGGRYIGDELASRGYVVLAIDALFWGERGRKEGVKYEAQQELAANLLQLGMTWSGVITWDDLRSAEFLASQPEVDPEHIAAVGLSMGSHRTWTLCAATDIVKAGMAICWLGDTQTLMAAGNNQTTGQSAFSMLAPGLRNYLDYPDVASIACPKPMLFYNGLQDPLFPVEGVEAAYKVLTEVYESQGAGDKLERKLWDVPHLFNAEMQEAAFEWLAAQLP